MRSLGRGVAFSLESPALAERRAAIARRFQGRLTAQDSRNWRPHVTVQNKVSPAEAGLLLATLAASFEPFTANAAAFELHAYLGGPWERVLAIELGA